MKLIMIYFSGTGNTKLIGEKILEHAAGDDIDVEMLPVEKLKDISLNDKINENEDVLLGLGFPVYDLMYPKIMNDVISELEMTNKKIPVFIYSTMAFIDGDCHAHLVKVLKNKGYYTIAAKSFMCPSNGVYTYENKDHNRYRNVRFEEGIDDVISQYLRHVVSKYKEFTTYPFSIKLPILPYYSVVRFFSNKLYGDKYYRNLEISDNCTNCGLCVEMCPDDNLHFTNNSVQIKDDSHCLNCLRCVSICPQKAINFTSSTMKNQYTKDVINRLYNKVSISK